MTESRTPRSRTGLNSYQDPIVEEPDGRSDATAPPPIPRLCAPRQSVLRRPGLFEASAAASSSGSGSGSNSRPLRFNSNATTVPPPQLPPANANSSSISLLKRQPVLSATSGRGSGSAMSTVIEEPVFSDDLDGDYATPPWDNTVNERSQLLVETGGAYYSGEISSRDVDSRNNSVDNAEGYEEDVFDDDVPLYIKSVYMLSCSILMIVSVVFVIVVSGLTKLVSRRGEPKFHVRSNWPSKGFIPAEYGCNAPNGKPQSIPLTWFNVPKEATNLVLLLTSDTNHVHWLVNNISLTDSEGVVIQQLAANASENEALMPDGAHQLHNFYRKSGRYAPPCAARNQTNKYLLYLFAIDASARIRADYESASQVVNGFVGVPTARLQGKYGGTSRNIEVVGHDHDDGHDNGHKQEHQQENKDLHDDEHHSEHAHDYADKAEHSVH